MLNPVRAGLASHPREWRWSSYNATIGEEPRPTFLSTSWVLSLFSEDPNRARQLYSEFVEARSAGYRRSRRVPVPGTRTGPDQPYQYTPGKHFASRPTRSAAGSPTTFS